MALKGKKQSAEHIRKRVEAIAKTRESWTEEQHESFANKVREVIQKRDPETQRKFTHCHIGKPAWNKGKQCPQWSGENHWNFGGNMSQGAVEKIRQSNTGKKQSPEWIANRVAGRKGYRHPETFRQQMSDMMKKQYAEGKRKRLSGENSPSWKGGISFEPYPITWSFALREAIRDRDGRKCCICGIGENGKRHDVHHIDYDKKNINPLNLLTLCHSCHMKTGYRREYWIAVLRNIVNSPNTKITNIS
jgi:hypothetical protein